MKWSPLLMLFVGCSSWELTHTEKDISSCWFSSEDPVPVEGGLDWGITANDMNVGYDFPYDGIDQNCDGSDIYYLEEERDIYGSDSPTNISVDVGANWEQQSVNWFASDNNTLKGTKTVPIDRHH